MSQEQDTLIITPCIQRPYRRHCVAPGSVRGPAASARQAATGGPWTVTGAETRPRPPQGVPGLCTIITPLRVKLGNESQNLIEYQHTSQTISVALAEMHGALHCLYIIMHIFMSLK